MAQQVENHGQIMAASHAATTELSSSDFRMDARVGKTQFWVRSTRGGTLKVYRYDAAGTARLVHSATIAANSTGQEGAIYQYRVARGYAGFTPADATSGTTEIEVDEGA